jgi:hypothetical protein
LLLVVLVERSITEEMILKVWKKEKDSISISIDITIVLLCNIPLMMRLIGVVAKTAAALREMVIPLMTPRSPCNDCNDCNHIVLYW